MISRILRFIVDYCKYIPYISRPLEEGGSYIIMWRRLWKKQKLTFNILICLEQDGDRFYAHSPSLKGIHVDGDTQEEALRNVKIATVLYIQSLIKHGDPIPLQIIQTTELKEHCNIGHGSSVLRNYPKTELVQVPV